MLNIRYIREHADKIREAIKNKRIQLDLDRLLALDERRREILTKISQARARRKELAKSGKGGRLQPERIEEGKRLKSAIAELEESGRRIEEDYAALMVKVPIIPSQDTPVGKDDSENVEVYRWGEPTKFDFPAKSHVELGHELDLLDLKRGAKVAGYRGYYVKNEAVALQMGLMMYAMHKLVLRGFLPMIPPTLVREYALFGSGYFSGRSFDQEVDEIYKVANRELDEEGRERKESKFLVGTAEPSLLSYYSGEVLEEEELPVKLCGFSQCYRSEIGSHGKDTRGIYRVHEFMKVEQVCIAKADAEEADRLHGEMVAISKELHEELELPYRQLAICTGDMSAGKYKMFDLEAWIPSRNGYGETGSASNFLDWQSRRLNVKYRTGDGKKRFVYMLNNTAIPSPRFLIAILENHQLADGSVAVPKVLRKYIPGSLEIIRKSRR